jgi:hypothetical protein
MPTTGHYSIGLAVFGAMDTRKRRVAPATRRESARLALAGYFWMNSEATQPLVPSAVCTWYQL